MAASRIAQALSTQVELEYLSSQRYSRLSHWCAIRNLDALSCFLQSRAQESITLMALEFNYLKRIDSTPEVCSTDNGDCQCFSIEELFEQTLLDLRIRLSHLSHLSRMVRESGDFATLAFIQKLFGQYRQERERLMEVQQQSEGCALTQPGASLRSTDETCCDSV